MFTSVNRHVHFEYVDKVKICIVVYSTFKFIASITYAITIDTKNRLILLICLNKTSDEGVYRKAKKCLKLNNRSLIRHKMQSLMDMAKSIQFSDF